MNFTSILAWLYWNPPKEAFYLPFVEQPVVWYGILFVSGFVLGYFLINPIIAKFLRESCQLSLLDISNWNRLVDTYRYSTSSVVQGILKCTDQKIIDSIKNCHSIHLTQSDKKNILIGINQYLSQNSLSRDVLISDFRDVISTPKQTAYYLTDRLCWFIVIGTLIGARFGEVFFYNWSFYSAHPIEILKTWNGGLASHGGVIGVAISIYFFSIYVKKYIPEFSFMRILDFVAIPSALAAFFIRMGNFVNQEILGTPTLLPWGVIFGNPHQEGAIIPRHPVQLYEGFSYLIIFVILFSYWKYRKQSDRSGAIVGLLFILIFSARFVLEFWKSTQPSPFNLYFLQTGQLLSIPFIFIGCFLWWNAVKSDKLKSLQRS
ncbi:MAG: prolipoprotein diacylglyceryl transferase [Parachlamydiaceae bacterium]|nr:prolipoprotein diacylglyceryl transferase [Parachlamydiaceae bacterium]